MDEALLRDGYSPLTAPPSEVTLKRPANVDSQTDRNSPVVPETSLTGRPENDEERRVVTERMPALRPSSLVQLLLVLVC